MFLWVFNHLQHMTFLPYFFLISGNTSISNMTNYLRPYRHLFPFFLRLRIDEYLNKNNMLQGNTLLLWSVWSKKTFKEFIHIPIGHFLLYLNHWPGLNLLVLLAKELNPSICCFHELETLPFVNSEICGKICHRKYGKYLHLSSISWSTMK